MGRRSIRRKERTVEVVVILTNALVKVENLTKTEKNSLGDYLKKLVLHDMQVYIGKAGH